MRRETGISYRSRIDRKLVACFRVSSKILEIETRRWLVIAQIIAQYRQIRALARMPASVLASAQLHCVVTPSARWLY